MKYQRFAALVLAAALLTGCGGTQSSPSAAADQSSDSSRSTPGAVAQAVQTDRITDQYTLEKNVSGVWGEEAVQCISVHVPKLERRLRQSCGAQPLRRHRPVALQRLVLRFCHRQADHHSRDAAVHGAGPGRSAGAGAAAGHAGL